MAEVVGRAFIVIALFTDEPTQLEPLVSTTLTFPAPAAPHVTVMLLVFVPEVCAPPVIVHTYVLPTVLVEPKAVIEESPI